ncbi:MAG TPA: M55 family metallopeptidase, partial [Holophaga sp.]|nr:M55 family metallopeptidase [Holophaga sp.]
MNLGNTQVLVNGREASECLINAYTAASFGVPLILVSGDAALCRSVHDLNPGIRTVAVSEGQGGASTSIHPMQAVKRIKRAAADALHEGPSGELVFPPCFDLEIRFKQHGDAHRASFYPGAVRKGPLAVAYACSEWFEALRFFFFVL